MRIVVAVSKRWTAAKMEQFCSLHKDIEVHAVHGPAELTYDFLQSICPDYVFFPHWSWRIPREIHSSFRCILFHPSDLPFGRGGTPVQNLIASGAQTTKLSAIEAAEEMDAGDILLKRELSLLGTGEEIYLRIQDMIFDDMIPFILENHPQPVPQEGGGTMFKRRSPAMGRLTAEMTLAQVFDTIRMLDADGYPHAFIELGGLRFTFTRASLKTDGIIADVAITQQGGTYGSKR